jgi:hypothetical protein
MQEPTTPWAPLHSSECLPTLPFCLPFLSLKFHPEDKVSVIAGKSPAALPNSSTLAQEYIYVIDLPRIFPLT